MRGEDDLVNRQRGFLTQHDREYLLGQHEDMSDNYEQQKRYQIRERFRHTMFDFYFMSNHLSDRDKRLLWPEIDNWLWQAQNRRQRQEEYEYPDLPLLAKCWRDVVSLFIECHIMTGIPESEQLAKWIIEEGVNKAVRRKTLQIYQMYRDVNANLDWGVGESEKLLSYLQRVANQMPADSDEAEDYLNTLVRQGYLSTSHSVYLYHTYVEDN